MMAIPEKEYIELKEYWDFQRKKEYNKEKVIKMCESFGGRLYDQFGQVPLQDIKDTIWTKIPQSEYEEPPKNWIPENPKYRLWSEGEPSNKTTGEWSEAFKEMNKNNE
jgi:hypothetical protein